MANDEGLLDDAGEVFGWHEDWPEAKVSTWHLIPDLDAVRKKWRKTLALPREKKSVVYLDVCGECFRRFPSTDRAEAAASLRAHIEGDPCPHYREEDPFCDE